MEGKNYRIIVEPIEGPKEGEHSDPPEVLRGGVACNGFVILAFDGKTHMICEHMVNEAMIAMAISSDKHLREAAKLVTVSGYIAKGLVGAFGNKEEKDEKR